MILLKLCILIIFRFFEYDFFGVLRKSKFLKSVILLIFFSYFCRKFHLISNVEDF
jgi:hypothetical protein